MGTIPCGFGASTTAQGPHLALSSDPGFWLTTFQILTDKCGGNGMMMHPYPHPPSTAYEDCQSPFICREWMWEPIHVGLEPQPLHKDFIWRQAVTSGFELTSQILTDRCGGNGMMMHPYPHPLHMKIVNHLSYVWSGCGNQSMWVWSLNHCTRTSFGAKQ